MKKDVSIILGLFVIIVLLLVFGKGFTSAGIISGGSISATGSAAKTGLVKVNSGKLDISAQVASTPDSRKKGLGKLDSLPVDRGMLFVFEKEGPYAIWMKDMRFAIDIIWIDQNKKIVDIAENVPSQPGKNDKDLTIYNSKEAAKYILEINAGLIKLNNVKVGDKVDFNL